MTARTTGTSAGWAAASVLVLALTGLIALRSPYVSDLLLRMSTLVILATSWSLMANAGLISLGHSAFWGLGAYVSMSVANRFSVPFAVALLPACLAGAIVGAVLAAVTGRLRGVFFAITTLALSEGLRVAALMLPGVTGGAVGLYIRENAAPSPLVLQAMCAALAVLAVGFAFWLTSTRLHFASRALRNSEQASQMLGIDPRRYRITVIAISGAMASLAGGLNAGYTGYLDPDIAFSLVFTLLPQIAVILGGLFTVAGPAIGAVVIMALSEATRRAAGTQAGASLLVYGVLLVFCVRLLPEGIVGLWIKARRRRQAAPRPA